MQEEENVLIFYSDDMNGDQYYLDNSQDGHFGAPALVNENGVVYPKEVHERLIDLINEELAISVKIAHENNIAPDVWAATSWPETEKIIKNRWFSLDYPQFEDEEEEAA